MVEVPATRPGAADISTSRPWLSVARVGKLMLARPASSGGCILAGRPNEIDTDHSSSGGRCSRSHTSRASCAVLATRLNITSRPSACAPTAIRWGGPPPGAGSADHAFHGPWPGPACRRCHRVPSLVLVNSSSRSSLFRVSADPPISAACTGGFSSECHPVHVPGWRCRLCQNTLPTTTISRRPSGLLVTAGHLPGVSRSSGFPSEAQFVVHTPLVPCSACQIACGRPSAGSWAVASAPSGKTHWAGRGGGQGFGP